MMTSLTVKPLSMLLLGALTLSACQKIDTDSAPKLAIRSGAVSSDEIQVAPPVATPETGSYSSRQVVTLSTPTAGATIYFTTDGSIPTRSARAYNTPVSVDVSQTIRAFALKSGFRDSEAVSFEYRIQGTVVPPSFSLPEGSYGAAQSLILSSATPGATIYYTTDGSEPTTSSVKYESPLTVSSSQTIKAVAVFSDWQPSLVTVSNYTINGRVSKPTATPAAGTYTTAQTVELATATAGAVIHYTLDGADPTRESTVYSGPIFVGVGQAIKAVAVKDNYLDSEISTFTFNITGKLPAPVFSVAPGSYGPAQEVEITSGNPAAKIHFTTDGNDPTPASPEYTVKINVTASQTIKAVAVLSDWISSDVSAAQYTINGAAETPVAMVAGGTYHNDQSVTLSTVPMAAAIYYTTDGVTTPTSQSTLYNGTITISGTTTIKAVAIMPGYINSEVMTAAYTLAASSPTTNVTPGPYTSIQSVTLTSATSGATIRYTTGDGTQAAPTCSSGSTDMPISMAATSTIKAITCKAGYADSDVVVLPYNIIVLPPVISYSQASFTLTAGSSATTITPVTSGGAISSCLAVPTLPAGLTLGGTDCSISGAPTYGGPQVTYMITPTNAGGAGSSVSLTIDIVGPDSTNKYWLNGLDHPGLDSSGTGLSTRDQKYYVNRNIANGFFPDAPTVLLMNMDNVDGATNFIDYSSNQNTPVGRGQAILSTAQKKSGSSSLYLNGSDQTDLQIQWNVGYMYDDFSVEAWVQLSTLNAPGGLHPVICGSGDGFCFGFTESGTNLALWRGLADLDLQGSVSILAGTWYHIALTRQNGIVRIFLDGNVVAEGFSWRSYAFENAVHIGSYRSASDEFYFNGYIDELRITHDVSRYNSNFVPSELAFSIMHRGYYINGFYHPGLNSEGSGYSTRDQKWYANGSLANGTHNFDPSWNNDWPYYIDGVGTTLNPWGFGLWNGIYYVWGQPTTLPQDGTGYWNGMYYVEGYDSPLDSSGTGFWPSYFNWMTQHSGTYFVSGRITNLDWNGNGYWNGTYYLGGQPTTLTQEGSGAWDGVYYDWGQPTTLDLSGTGVWNGYFYFVGYFSSGAWDGTYYIMGRPTTLDLSGTGVTNALGGWECWVNGILQSEAVDYNGDGICNGTQYINGQPQNP